MRKGKPSVVVVGSLNIDWTARVCQLPTAGQTVAAASMMRFFGGKGANQAIAASRQGADVTMIGCVGDDDAGSAYREHLRSEKINESSIATQRRMLTGMAMIAVDAAAENTIIVNKGANDYLSIPHIRRHRQLLATADALLIQWEIPMTCVLEVLRLAEISGTPVVMNPSPYDDSFPWGKHPIHTLIVNEDEAASYFGGAYDATAENLRPALTKYHLERLIVTRGSKPTWGVTQSSVLEEPTFPVVPVDTVGAGDTFAGAYTAALARGHSFSECLRYANIAGALATTKQGAQDSIPTLGVVKTRLRELASSPI
jgi:ribokinase